MKKIIALFLLFIYTISSNGISLSYFYCCGKLRSISLTSREESKNCIYKSTPGGCENKTVTFKLKSDQKTNPVSKLTDFKYLVADGDLNQGKWHNIFFKEVNISFNDPPSNAVAFSQGFLCIIRV